MKVTNSLIIVILILSISFLQSQTIIPAGPVTGNWSVGGSPYIVTGDIYIIDSLIIKPGVVVQFQAGGWQLEAGTNAKLIAEGKEDSVIVFEAFQGQNPGSWNRIFVNESSDNDVFRYCTIRYATYGIYDYNSSPTIENCTIYKNSEFGIVAMSRVGTYEDTIKNCIIFNNLKSGIHVEGYDRYGAASEKVVIYRCIIYDNAQNGVIVYSGTWWNWGNAYSLANIINCTIFGNQTGVRAYAYRGYADAKIANSIVAFNTGYGVTNQDSRSYIGENDIIYNCFWGNEQGNFNSLRDPVSGFGQPPTNINVNGDSCDVNFNIYYDPLFVDTSNSNFHLQPNSNCINAGTPIILGQYLLDPDSTLPDMGAFYFNTAMKIQNTYAPIPNQFYLQQNYPNPFNPVTHIPFTLPRASQVKIEIYNLLGERVVVLLNERKPAGSYTVEFYGSGLLSWVYLFRMQAGEFRQMRKMILMK